MKCNAMSVNASLCLMSLEQSCFLSHNSKQFDMTRSFIMNSTLSDEVRSAYCKALN